MDPITQIISLVYTLFVFILSSILHEFFHGWTADKLGDPTARYAGRLTLDPRAHIDAWGTIFMPLLLFTLTNGRFLFAYAKPVPYNVHNLRNKKWGPALIGIAGPLANLGLAVVFSVVFRLLVGVPSVSPVMLSFIADIVYANVLLMFFNLVPIPPLDGSKILLAVLPDSLSSVRDAFEKYGVWILIIFVLFVFKYLYPLFYAIMRLLLGQW